MKIVFLFHVLILLVACGSGTGATNAIAESMALIVPVSELDRFKEQVIRMNDSLDTSMSQTEPRTAKAAILAEADLFDSVADLINSAPDTMAVDLLADVVKLKARLIKAQVAGFPVLRKDYALWCSQQVWEYYTTVVFSGNSNTALTFTAAEFANNENIEIIQLPIAEDLRKLRFMRTNYKWNKFDTNNTHHTLDSKKDKDL